jgi:hypothetical protein
MSWTKPRAGWEDQTFNSKDVFAAANKRIRPADELEEGERPVLESGGLFDVANQLYIKLHEQRKRDDITAAREREAKDSADFKALSVEVEANVESKQEELAVEGSVLQSLSKAVSQKSPIQPKRRQSLLSGYSSDEEPPRAKKRPPPAKELFAKLKR